MPRRAPLFAALALIVACQPPPEVPGGGGDVSVRILYPPADIGEIGLDADGVLRIFTVVDINGLEFVPPSESDGTQVAGECHYHVTLNGVYQGAPDEQFYFYESTANEFTAGTAMSLRMSLATADHQDLDEFEDWETIIEFNVAAAQ